MWRDVQLVGNFSLAFDKLRSIRENRCRVSLLVIHDIYGCRFLRYPRFGILSLVTEKV